MKRLTVCVVWAVFMAHTALAQQTAQAPLGSLHFARWNISNGQYLIEVGQYLEALEAFQTALEATTSLDIRADAHLNRATVLATYLDAFDDAAQEYRRILQAYAQTRQAETALFRLGMLLFEQQRYQAAVSQFERYLQRYPQGRFAPSAETLLRSSRQALSAPLPLVPTVPSADRPVVRVRLLKGVNRLVLRSTVRLSVTSGAGHTVYQGQGPVALQSGADDILVQRQPSRSRTFRITAAAPIQVMQKDVRCGRRQAATAGLYRGALRVFLQDGKLRVVNDIDIEAYLYGVVPAEVPGNWPLEALKAQAIAARTYALYQSQHRQNWRFDVVDSQGDQVYKGVRCEARSTTRAVDATRGMILVHHTRPNRPILAMYTSNTGWHSAHVGYIFSQPLPYLVGVKDPYSPTQPMGRWRRVHRAADIRRKLADLIRGRVDAIEDIRPQEVTPSGRIKKVVLVYAGGRRVLRTRTTLKRALKLPDILVGITRQGDSFVFNGGGFGHGVGLSQWGAKAMAEAGKTVDEIVRFYYRGVRVKQAW